MRRRKRCSLDLTFTIAHAGLYVAVDRMSRASTQPSITDSEEEDKDEEVFDHVHVVQFPGHDDNGDQQACLLLSNIRNSRVYDACMH
jgi:hypothetical protein